MIQLALAWLALCAAQDPDLSTPEKAFESFTAFWLKWPDPTEAIEKMRDDTEALADAFRTDGYRAKLKERREKQREASKKVEEDHKVLSSNIKYSRTVQNADGTATVEGVQTFKRRQPWFEMGKIELKEVEERAPYHVVFEKSRAVWLVRRVLIGCSSCNGEGVCRGCKGTGWGAAEECLLCRGDKICGQCNGKKMGEVEFAKGAQRFTIAGGEPAYSQDLSSPNAAAQAIADLKLRQSVFETKAIRGVSDRLSADFPTYFAPSVVKAVNEMVAKAVEEGKKRFRDERPAVDAVEEKGETVHVTLKNVGERRLRYVLKKAGGGWRIDGEQRECFVCKGTGKHEGDGCFACGGAGWDDE